MRHPSQYQSFIDQSFPARQPAFWNQRSRQRHLLQLPAWVVFYRLSQKKRPAKVRDMTRQGMFLYSDVSCRPGEEIEFVLKFPAWTHCAPIACKGQVIRVENAARENGVALRLNRFFVLQ